MNIEHAPGIQRDGIHYPAASAAQRWWARIIDGLVVFSATIGGAVIGGSAVGAGGDQTEAELLAALASFAGASMLLGLLYGWGAGLGQAIVGVKSRRLRDGRHVGGFRGWMRYWAIAFFPLACVALVIGLFNGSGVPSGWSDEVKVFKRRGRQN